MNNFGFLITPYTPGGASLTPGGASLVLEKILFKIKQCAINVWLSFFKNSEDFRATLHINTIYSQRDNLI